MASDEEDFVFYGTPIEREEEIMSRKKKAIASASGNLRTLAVWKQEVTDEEGRRRFHGAFTGGFSAGYYNTVGSKEGWTPQSFTSSRKNRAEAKKQSISDFLDEDEKAELEGQTLATSSHFDTFGFTAAEYARKQAEKEQHQRPSTIPGPVPDELIVPATESIGVKLLLKMGWRRGHSIKDLRASSDARREARKAFLAFSANDEKMEAVDSKIAESELGSSAEPEINNNIHVSQSTPVYVLNPKQDLYGLGFDPFEHAPEFRERKRSRMSSSKELGFRKPLSMKESLLGFKRKAAPGFGIGALEELDVEDEDIYASGYDFEETFVEEDEEPSRPDMDNKPRLTAKERDVLPGFRVASNSDFKLERFDPPEIPKDFIAHHKFPGPLETSMRLAVPPPQEVPPPEDNNLKLLIEGVATLVARCGKLFEDLSKEKNQSNPLFGFLRGGNGQEYYARKLWEELQKLNDQNKQSLVGKLSPSERKMTAETRGRLLGERPLEKSSKDVTPFTSNGSSVQFPVNLSDAFTRPESFSKEALGVLKPFKDDPAKQERFEQFLKEKYQGGLRSTESGRANDMSEAARARERLDFEAAAEAIEKGKSYREEKHATELSIDFLAPGGLQFTCGGTRQAKDVEAKDLKSKKIYPKREEFQWRPAPVLCKRFDLPDPYMGKPPPAPRPRSKMDSFFFMSNPVKSLGLQGSLSEGRDPVLTPQPDSREPNREVAEKETEAEVEVENVERPVDLYKAIFSDDSENEEAEVPTTTQKPEDLEKKNEAAATTLNRLIAGDFLESLGKELGLEVPPDVTPSQPMPPKADTGKAKAKPPGDQSSKGEPKEDSSENNKAKLEEMGQVAKKNDAPPSKNVPSSSEGERNRRKGEKLPSHPRREGSSSESSEDERRRKRSKGRRHRNSDPYSDSSSGDGRRSRGKRKEHSRSSKKHSKHHKHRSKNSSSRSSRCSSDEEREEHRREKRKRRD